MGPLGVPELIIVAFFGIPYFLPTIVAGARAHPNMGPIAVINTFLGWTFVGWVVALAMSVSHINNSARDTP